MLAESLHGPPYRQRERENKHQHPPTTQHQQLVQFTKFHTEPPYMQDVDFSDTGRRIGLFASFPFWCSSQLFTHHNNVTKCFHLVTVEDNAVLFYMLHDLMMDNIRRRCFYMYEEARLTDREKYNRCHKQTEYSMKSKTATNSPAFAVVFKL